jgi:hypothetical protein
MEPANKLAIATLRTLIRLHQNEEKRLRALLTDSASSSARIQAEFDLERLLRQMKAQLDELAKLEAGT